MDEDDAGEVSARGATMSSIVFRDLSSAGSSRSASPWQQNGTSAGLAMFATSSFGGDPLRVLANLDEELGAAHMGPRIYKRHNHKHVRNRVKAKIDAAHAGIPLQNAGGKNADAKIGGMPGETSASVGRTAPDVQTQQMHNLDLQQLVEQCRRANTLAAVQSRVASLPPAAAGDGNGAPETRLLAAVEARIADPTTWSSHHHSAQGILTDDLLPTGLQQPGLRLDVLPSSLQDEVRQAVLRGLGQLVDGLVHAERSELVEVLARLLLLQALRPTGARVMLDAQLTTALQQIFLGVLGVFHRATDSAATAGGLLADVLARCTALAATHPDAQDDVLVGLVGELVGLCGQQMSSNPAVLSPDQDAALVSLARFLSLCFVHNTTRAAAHRLPVHAFYCTVLDLAPFLEHFAHHAASRVRLATPTAGMAQFNVFQAAFLVSLGAKVRMMQLENEVRLARVSPRTGGQRLGLEHSKGEAQLVVMPASLSLKIERKEAWAQSRELLTQVLEGEVDQAAVRALRVEFAGEHAADGGGPAREWFATVTAGWNHSETIAHHGWFLLTPNDADDSDAEITAAFLGLLLGLAALHSAKLTLPFALPDVAFKIATAADLDSVSLLPMDLEFVDARLARSLQAVLDWQPPAGIADADGAFDATFSLTWSTTIRTHDGGIKTIDLVPGGRHRAVRMTERHDFVSKLIWRVLVGSARGRVGAFHAAWQSIMPSAWLGKECGAESASDVLARGGLAVSLFAPSELNQALVALPASPSASVSRLDVQDLRASTEVISQNTDARVVEWFWEVWAALEAEGQRRMLAFITGAQDLPATGARGVGLRIHIVPTERADAKSWPLPWSSTCTATLFLPTYPTRHLLEQKVAVAIEHFQGFGLR